MPELPEVEITARLIGDAVAGVGVESVATPGLNTLRSFKPPVQDLEGHPLRGIRRRGKLFIVESGAGLSMIIHLMSSGRLQLWEKRAAATDRRSRLLVRLVDGRELRLREFGTRQRAWAQVVPTDELDDDETLNALGPEAWPDPPDLKPLLETARPLYSELRDQRV
ncbi:MAG: DNA-formamidopyrimidine glycosylase, partial [Actinomycetota bacterium]|nr:DNA-formamidopyrimidine glycosylase [Actinomycetota bacterium]